MQTTAALINTHLLKPYILKLRSLYFWCILNRIKDKTIYCSFSMHRSNIQNILLWKPKKDTLKHMCIARRIILKQNSENFSRGHPILLLRIKNRLVFSQNTKSSIYLLERGWLVLVLLYHLQTFLNKISGAVVIR